jgi:hypothetical protein
MNGDGGVDAVPHALQVISINTRRGECRLARAIASAALLARAHVDAAFSRAERHRDVAPGSQKKALCGRRTNCPPSSAAGARPRRIRGEASVQRRNRIQQAEQEDAVRRRAGDGRDVEIDAVAAIGTMPNMPHPTVSATLENIVRRGECGRPCGHPHGRPLSPARLSARAGPFRHGRRWARHVGDRRGCAAFRCG